MNFANPTLHRREDNVKSSDPGNIFMSPPPPPEVAPPEVAPPNASTSPDCGAIRRRFAAAHRLRLRQWYESAPSVGELFPERIRWRFMGRFVAPHGAPSTREHLWNALALLASDDHWGPLPAQVPKPRRAQCEAGTGVDVPRGWPLPPQHK